MIKGTSAARKMIGKAITFVMAEPGVRGAIILAFDGSRVLATTEAHTELDKVRMTLMADRFTDFIAAPPKPLDMLLFCPNCGRQHIDAPEPGTEWTNPPHRSHKCHGCAAVWRPADVATNGVARIATKGTSDTWAPHADPVAPALLASPATDI